MPRTPKPVAPPSTLTEAVLDLERRMSGGDALSEVLLPADEWLRLVELAGDEEEDFRRVEYERGIDSVELLGWMDEAAGVNCLRIRVGSGGVILTSEDAAKLSLYIAQEIQRLDFRAVPPPKKERKRKAKAEEPVEAVEPEAPQHRMVITDVEEDAA